MIAAESRRDFHSWQTRHRRVHSTRLVTDEFISVAHGNARRLSSNALVFRACDARDASMSTRFFVGRGICPRYLIKLKVHLALASLAISNADGTAILMVSVALRGRAMRGHGRRYTRAARLNINDNRGRRY